MKSYRLALVPLLFLLLVTASCVTESSPPISSAAVRQELASGALLVDVRTPAEFKAGHHAGAILLPVSTIQQDFPRLYPDRSQATLLYCRSGRRSGIAEKQLRQLGYTNVVNLGSYQRAGKLVGGGRQHDSSRKRSACAYRESAIRSASELPAPGRICDAACHSIAVKVLLVEDEKKIASFVRKGLETQGFVVETASNGDDGFVLATTRPYDAVVLDIMLPGRDGLSILRTLRDRRISLPVILLTARSELNERLEGLNLGADDYLTKPFHIEELIARLHAVVRRNSGAAQSLLRAGNLIVNLLTRKVERGGQEIELTAREFSLLEHLMRSPGRVLTRIEICERVWDYNFDPGTNLVDVYVQRLRKKIDGDCPDKLIETIRGVGYRIKANP